MPCNNVGLMSKLVLLSGKTSLCLSYVEQGYSSVFLGIGAYESKRLGLKGENSTKGVMSGVDYLVQVLTGREIALGDRVLVVGGR